MITVLCVVGESMINKYITQIQMNVCSYFLCSVCNHGI